MIRIIDFKSFIHDLNLEVLNRGKNELKIETNRMASFGLALLGYQKENIDKTLLLIGHDELALLMDFSKDNMAKVESFLASKPLALIFSDNLLVPDFLLSMAEKNKIWLLRSKLDFSFLYYKIYSLLKEKLEPRLTIHATFMNIHGMGVLLQGESGIGKSETALDLIKRGHELISDDITELFEGSSGYLIGEAPEILKRKLEIRGTGIVDVVNMFGASSYYPRKKVDLVIELRAWDKDTDYDRLGIEANYVKFLRNEVRKMVIPVLPGRNIALLVESATLKAKLIKYMNVDDSKEFIDKLDNRRRKD